MTRELVHYVGITKGLPVPPEPRAGVHRKQAEHEARRIGPRGRSRMLATWHGTCSCGWVGEDHLSPEQAQQDALSHQAGRQVIPVQVAWPLLSRRKRKQLAGQLELGDWREP